MIRIHCIGPRSLPRTCQYTLHLSISSTNSHIVSRYLVGTYPPDTYLLSPYLNLISCFLEMTTPLHYFDQPFFLLQSYDAGDGFQVNRCRMQVAPRKPRLVN